MDPITLVMFALIAVLIIFMFRNGKKRQQAQQELQSGLRPGAEVMLQSGIFGTIESVEEEENRVTLRSGSSTLVVHRNAVTQIIAPTDAPEEADAEAQLAPDDDPEFGERVANGGADDSASAVESDVDGKSDGSAAEEPSDPDAPASDDSGDQPKPQA